MSDDTRELFTPEQFQRWLVLAAIAVVLAGVAFGVVSRKALGSARAALLRGVAVALLGPLALLLWSVYNRIEDHFGLDSVAALLINLGLFAMAGVGIGAAMSWIWGRTAPPEAEGDPPPASGQPAEPHPGTGS